MADLRSLSVGCAGCKVCEGAGYQTPPVLYAGNPDAKIIAIGQNPGEIKAADRDRQFWMDAFKRMDVKDVASILPAWYQWDFGTSPGHRHMASVFGSPSWLLDGGIMWTNAVRCRTKNNASPSDAMVTACNVWTESLLEGKKAIILVGNVARSQVLGVDAPKLEWGIPRKHPRFGLVLAIKHYAAWATAEETTQYSEAFRRIVEKLK